MTKPIKCYVLARSVEDAQAAAQVGGRLFEVTITANPCRQKAKRSKGKVVSTKGRIERAKREIRALRLEVEELHMRLGVFRAAIDNLQAVAGLVSLPLVVGSEDLRKLNGALRDLWDARDWLPRIDVVRSETRLK